MSREGKAYLLTWTRGYGHSAVLIENGSIDHPRGMYISFYPGDGLYPPSSAASSQSSARSATRSGGSGSRSTSGFGFKEGGFKTFTHDMGDPTASYACDEIIGLDYEAMIRELENIRAHNYALTFYNCADAAETILRAGGLEALRRDYIISMPSSLRQRVANAAGTQRRALDERRIPFEYRDRFNDIAATGNLLMPTRTGDYLPAMAPESATTAQPILKFTSATTGYSSPSSQSSPGVGIGLHAAQVHPMPTPAFTPVIIARGPETQVAKEEDKEGEGEGRRSPPHI
ncbi:MAG TPA: hypothetical protein VD770_03300 [Coxiellaceae bacterium]|nr:hypothetical protein [Coxiellaceae bacterium]